MTTVTELLQPVEKDLEDLILELKNLIGAGHPILQAAAEHLFSAGGKRRKFAVPKTEGSSLETGGDCLFYLYIPLEMGTFP